MRTASQALQSVTLAALVCLPMQTMAGGDLEACLKAVAAVKAGSFVKVEKLVVVEGGEPTYEVEVRDSGGVEWEFMCAADDARIYEIEREAKDADDAAFKNKAKISRQAAAATATAMFPGKIEETEYEIESNGDPSYEFDIVDGGGKEFKVEIDAVSGKIIEVSVEAWEIGEEPDERD